MIINGEHKPNVSCPQCRFRHPADLSCEEAHRHANQGAGHEESERRKRAAREERLAPATTIVDYLEQWLDARELATASGGRLHAREERQMLVEALAGVLEKNR